MPLPLILFDDDSPWLAPLNDLRPTFAVRTGAMTTLERWGAMAGKFGAALLGVRPSERLRELTREVAGAPVLDAAGLPEGDVLFVSARCVLPFDGLSSLAPGTAVMQPGPGAGSHSTVVAARLSGQAARAFFDSLTLPSGTATSLTNQAKVLHRPWDVIRHRDACLDADLSHLAANLHPSAGRKHGATPDASITLINESAIHVHPSAKLSRGVILDAEGGPIVIDEGATIRPGSIIIGPAYIGKNSTILERALIKAHTAIGPVCKVTGEVGGTIFQGHANKGHDGHLGDSWVGEWANFGAGTTNSNLLNTYADVIATAMPRASGEERGAGPGGSAPYGAGPGGPGLPSRERTGIQYLGCIVGDHTKFAICTRIMTGSVFGTGCMVATTAAPPTCVPPFSWLTDERTQPYRFSKFLDVAKTVMARRKVVPSEAYVRAMERLA